MFCTWKQRHLCDHAGFSFMSLHQIQDFIEKKLLPQEQLVKGAAEQLEDRVDREVRQFGTIALPCLLRRDLPA